MKQERSFSQITNEALELLRRGKSIPAILARFPEEAERLAPLLETAQIILHSPQPQPPAGIEAASKAQMMQRLSDKKISFNRHKENIMGDLGTGVQRERGKRLILAIMSLVIIFIILSTITVSALAALPGSLLYPAKLALQDTLVLLTINPILKQARIIHYRQMRILDLKRAVELQRITEIEAGATITAMPTPKPIPTMPFPAIKP